MHNTNEAAHNKPHSASLLGSEGLAVKKAVYALQTRCGTASIGFWIANWVTHLLRRPKGLEPNYYPVLPAEFIFACCRRWWLYLSCTFGMWNGVFVTNKAHFPGASSMTRPRDPLGECESVIGIFMSSLVPAAYPSDSRTVGRHSGPHHSWRATGSRISLFSSCFERRAQL